MESIQRQIMLLRPGDGPYAHPQSRATLKLQDGQSGLFVSLTINSLPAGSYSLYLFLNDGAAIYAGDVANSGIHQTLPGIRLKSIWGAAIIHDNSHAFCLKSTGVDWTEVSARFKLMHAPRPLPPVPEPPEQPSQPTPQSALRLEPEPVPEPEPESVPECPENTAEARTENHAAGPLYMTPAYPFDTEDGPDSQESNNEPFQPISESDEEDEYSPCDSCPHATRQERINPFPSVFPQSEWVKMSYPGPTGWWHYITGRIYSGPNIVAKAVGVPGEYGMAPPVWLDGFGTYLRCVTQDAHGYWLMFQDAETGEILDLGLSPRDA